MKKFFNSSKSQTLIETLVAISVILVVAVATYGLFFQSLKTARLSLEKVQAFNLAQEGIEYIRSLRDQNYLNQRPWNEGFPSSRSEVFWSKFQRNITVSNITVSSCPSNSVCAVEVTSTVTWQSYKGWETMQLKERLYNWK